jgi:Domain of unknown function (DUF4440)
MKSSTFVLAILIALIGCQQSTPSDTVEPKAIVHAQNEKLKAFFLAGDMDKLSQLYTKNAKLSGDGNEDIVIGREAIRDFWKKAMDGVKVMDMNTQTLTIDAAGGVIYETGKVTNKIAFLDSVHIFKAKYVNVWRKEEGEYKLDVDSWTDIQ